MGFCMDRFTHCLSDKAQFACCLHNKNVSDSFFPGLVSDYINRPFPAIPKNWQSVLAYSAISDYQLFCLAHKADEHQSTSWRSNQDFSLPDSGPYKMWWTQWRGKRQRENYFWWLLLRHTLKGKSCQRT